MRLVTTALFLCLAGTLSAQVCHTSDASGTAYDDGWQTGDNDGSGFGPWTLTTKSPDPNRNGHFIGNSTFNNIGGDTNGDDDINGTAGRAWGQYANNDTNNSGTTDPGENDNNFANVARAFDTPMGPGSTFTWDFDVGRSEGQYSFRIQNGLDEILWAVILFSGATDYSYFDAGGVQGAGLGVTEEGVRVTFEVLDAVGGYRATLTRLVDNVSQAITGTMGGAGTDFVPTGFFAPNDFGGPGSLFDVFHNSFEVCYPAVACTTEAPLSFDYDGDGDGSSVMADDFDALGTDPAFGEFAGLRNESADTAVDLAGCSFVSFDPYTEAVTYAADPTGIVAPDGTFVFATQGADHPFGVADALYDHPGAFALVEGTAAVGEDVSVFMSRVVAAVVYGRDGSVYGSIGGGATPVQRASFGAAMASAFGGATAAEGNPEAALVVSVGPNPASGPVRIGFGLAEAGGAHVSVFDALGREVAVVASGPFAAGRHDAAFDVSALPVGVYVVRAATATEVGAAPLTVIR